MRRHYLGRAAVLAKDLAFVRPVQNASGVGHPTGAVGARLVPVVNETAHASLDERTLWGAIAAAGAGLITWLGYGWSARGKLEEIRQQERQERDRLRDMFEAKFEVLERELSALRVDVDRETKARELGVLKLEFADTSQVGRLAVEEEYTRQIRKRLHRLNNQLHRIMGRLEIEDDGDEEDDT